MEINILVTGSIIDFMGKVSMYSRRVTDMRENSEEEKRKDMESTFILMVTSMRGSGLKIKNMAKVPTPIY